MKKGEKLDRLLRAAGISNGDDRGRDVTREQIR